MIRRLLLALVSAAVVASPARATWSIVVVDRRTGEVGIASATCVDNIHLIARLPVALPGFGGGVVQAAGSFTDLVPMAQGLRERLAPADILEIVKLAEPQPNSLQTGIVALYPGVPVTFSGGGARPARAGVVGEVGDLAYSIQGNVLTSVTVVTAAQNALLATNGDLGQRLMAAMEAARALGGDGRCSCPRQPDPRDCGAPPPGFRKSAHSSFALVARMGDEQPPCLTGTDCQLDSFHLSLNVRGRGPDPDPVRTLAELYADWRTARAGRPDGILSTVEAVSALPADAETKRVVTVQLVDIEGVPLTHGGASVRVGSLGGVRQNILVGPVTDLGDGRYRFTLASTLRVGTDRFAITAEDDLVRATLFPFLEVESEAPSELHVGIERLSASAGGVAPFVLSRADLAGGAYLLLTSASGTSPGTPLPGGAVLPLVRDAWFWLSLRNAGDARFLPGTRGVLGPTGRAEASLVAPPGVLAALIGRRLSWAAILSSGVRVATTPAVGFEVVP